MKIIKDTREQKPWSFGKGNPVTVAKLNTGDYSIKGHESKIVIERKQMIELAGCISKPYFWKQMERLAKIPHGYLLIEASATEAQNFPWKTKMKPFLRKKIRVRGPYIMKQMERVEEMGVKIIWGMDRATSQDIAKDLFKDYLDNVA